MFRPLQQSHGLSVERINIELGGNVSFPGQLEKYVIM